MDVNESIIETDTDDGPMAVLRKEPAQGGDHPTIVLFHDGPGIRTATHEFAARLAAEGYVVAVPDLFHRHGRLLGIEPEQRAADPELVGEMMVRVQSLTDAGIQHDVDATLEALGPPSDAKLGCIGFCLGARAVFRTMMRLPEQFVVGSMWHPSFLADGADDSPHLTAGDLRGTLFIGIGEADEMQSIAMHQPFLDAVAPLDDVEVRTFPGADHGFSWPGYATYDENAATTSWDRTIELFDRTLR